MLLGAASSPTNIHGDILFTADGAGTRTGTIHLYDPYGQNVDPATGAFGDIPIPATAEGGMDFGWLGQHTVPIEHIASQQALEMGARTYLPILGRFLQTDPVPGGSANNYDYVNGDPVNSQDLSGKCPGCAAAVAVIPTIADAALIYSPGVQVKDRPIEAAGVNPSGSGEKSASASSPAPESGALNIRLLAGTSDIARGSEISSKIFFGDGSYLESRWYGLHMHLDPAMSQKMQGGLWMGAGVATLLAIGTEDIPAVIAAALLAIQAGAVQAGSNSDGSSDVYSLGGGIEGPWLPGIF
ncbi:RHS repeat-associated core domain-containing protein [Nocardia sp. NPDC050175]|uniref:RHS repeat-associated core domain-containing protein n=1 Tax=Nocardia sp. NPDC050175 TaxID=3364317 RepID=UPI003787A04C